jgi:hypothetical protein
LYTTPYAPSPSYFIPLKSVMTACPNLTSSFSLFAEVVEDDELEVDG